jgi:small nuclear ribonucleoprotein G
MATSKFQKGPDLKRFMVRSVINIISISICCSRLLKHFLFYFPPPPLNGCQDKRLKLLLNGNRRLIGTLRGYDAFLNVVLEEVEEDGSGSYLGQVVIRGNSIVQFEALERVY